MKLASTSIALAVVVGLTLAGCGTNTSTDTSTGASTTTNTTTSTTTTTTTTQDASASIKPGVEKLLAISADLKKAIDSGDDSQVQKTAPQLEATWSTFEDAVKPKYPDNYAEVEQYLDPTVAGSKVTPLDKSTLGKLNDQLSAALQKLEQKVQ